MWFRERRNILLTGRGLGISQATAYRYLAKAIDVLAAQAPDLHQARQRVADEGWSHVAPDGTVVACDRLAEKDQQEGQAHRRLVLGQDQRLRRQHTSRAAPRRAAGVGRRCRTRLDS